MPTPAHLGARAQHWVDRASVWQIIVVAALCGLGVWILSSGLDLLWVIYPGASVVAMSSADAILSIAFAVLLLKLMFAQRARHRKVVQQLAIIAEMNHQIRNALENIQLTTYFTHDQHLISEIHVSVQRIDWALREVLPKAAEDRDDDEVS